MAALAVRVIDDDVERRHRPEVSGPRGHEREVMLANVGDDELLQRAWSHRTLIAINRWWHDLPIERGADQIGSHLALAQGAIWEIVERRLTLRRFVDAERLGA